MLHAVFQSVVLARMESLRKLSGELARLSNSGPLGENPFARVSQLTVKEDDEKLEQESVKPGTIVDDSIPRTGWVSGNHLRPLLHRVLDTWEQDCRPSTRTLMIISNLVHYHNVSPPPAGRSLLRWVIPSPP